MGRCKLGTKHSYGKGTQVVANKGPLNSQKGDDFLSLS